MKISIESGHSSPLAQAAYLQHHCVQNLYKKNNIALCIIILKKLP